MQKNFSFRYKDIFSFLTFFTGIFLLASFMYPQQYAASGIGTACGNGGAQCVQIGAYNGCPSGTGGVCNNGGAGLTCCSNSLVVGKKPNPKAAPTKTPAQLAKAQPGDKCGTGGVNQCVTSTSGYSSCNATAGAGVCGNGGAKLYCCGGGSSTTSNGTVTPKVTPKPNPAQVGDKCGTNGVNQCVSNTTGYTSGTCSAAGAGVCGTGGSKLYCCPTKGSVAQAGSKCGTGGLDMCVASTNGYPAGKCTAAGAGVCGNGGAKYYCCAGARVAQAGDKCGTNGVNQCVTSTSGYASGTCTAAGAGVCGNGGAKLFCCAGTSSTTGTNGAPTTGGSGAGTPPAATTTTGYSCQCNTSDQFLCLPTGANVTTGLPNVTGSCSALSKANSAYSNSPISIGTQCGLPGVKEVTSADATTIAQTMCANTNASNTTCTSGATGGSTQQCTNVCNGISAGTYCGGTVGGNSNYLYVCDGSNNGPSGLTKCSTCQVNIPGTPDCCKGDSSCSGATPVGKITAISVSGASLLLASNVLAAQAIVLTDNLNYDSTTNSFSNPSFRITNLPPGTYNLFLHVNGYLDRELTNTSNNTFTITAGQAIMNVGPIQLIPGDIAPQPTGDNVIDIQDYNLVVGCLGTKAVTATCLNKAAADVNHDGLIDNKDLTIVQAGFNQKGDSINVRTQQGDSGGNDVNQGNGTSTPTHIPTFTCVTDPSCATKSSGSMQLCPLKCMPQ